MTTSEKIKAFWDEQGRSLGEKSEATNFDLFGRRREVEAILKYISDNDRIIDIGCGNGFVDFEISAKKNVTLLGIDFSKELVAKAKDRSSRENATRKNSKLSFEVGDVLNLSLDRKFDLAISTACLINLPTYEDQCKAIGNIASTLTDNGHYIMIENTLDGLEKINLWRRRVGHDEIPVRWHNNYFNEKDLIAAVEPYFDVLEINHFSSSYYFLSRVVYPLFTKKPKYNSIFNRIASLIPSIGTHCPTRLYYLKKKISRDSI